MKCEDCIHFENSYIPNRCYHDSNTKYHGGGMSCVDTARELNPSDSCTMGQRILTEKRS
jgi:hypothetical protein